MGNLLSIQDEWLPPATDNRSFYLRKTKSANIFFEKE